MPLSHSDTVAFQLVWPFKKEIPIYHSKFSFEVLRHTVLVFHTSWHFFKAACPYPMLYKSYTHGSSIFINDPSCFTTHYCVKVKGCYYYGNVS